MCLCEILFHIRENVFTHFQTLKYAIEDEAMIRKQTRE